MAVATESIALRLVDGVSPVFRTMGRFASRFADQQSRAMRRANDSIRRVMDTAKGFVVGNIINRGISLVTAGITDMTNQWILFDAASHTAATKFANDQITFQQSLEHTKRVSMEVGNQTAFTAGQVADGMAIMAMSGKTVEEASVNTMLAISKLATVAGTDIPTATSILNRSLAQWGKGFEFAGSMVDILANQSNSSMQSIEELSASMDKSALLWSNLGIPLDQAINQFLIANRVIAGVGLAGEEAGVNMRNMMANFFKPKALDTLDSLGVKVRTLDGNFRPFFDILTDINEILGETGKHEFGATLVAGGVIEKRNISAMTELLKLSTEQIRQYSDEAADYGSVAGIMFTDMSGSVQHMLEILKSNITSKFFAGLETGRDSLVGVIDDIDTAIRDFNTTKVTDWIGKNLPIAISNAKAAFIELAPYIKTTFGLLLNIGAWVIKYTPEILAFAGAIVAIRGAMLLFNTALAINAFRLWLVNTALGANLLFYAHYGLLVTWAAVTNLLTVAQTALNVALTANPIGLTIAVIVILVAAIAAAVAAIVMVVKKWNEWGDSIKAFWHTWRTVFQILSPGIYLIINAVILLTDNWTLLTESFKSGGIIGVFKEIGKIIWNDILAGIFSVIDAMHNFGLIGDATFAKLEAKRNDLLMPVNAVHIPLPTTNLGPTRNEDIGKTVMEQELNAIARNETETKNSFSGNIAITAPEGVGMETHFSDSVSISRPSTLGDN